MFKTLSNLLSSPKDKLQKEYGTHLEATLEQLEKLEQRMRSQSPIDALIDGFNILNEWHDLGGIKYEGKLPAYLQEAVEGFNRSVIGNRNMFGMNRTEKGQKTDTTNVYLGDIYGLFTKTAAYWKANGDDHFSPNMTFRQVIEGQAGNYLRNIILPTKNHIRTILYEDK